jgi:hypothetical protein
MYESKLRCRLYSTERTHPLQTTVAARGAGPTSCKTRYPFAESVLGGSTMQPYVHNCMVDVKERGRTYRFTVFFKRHCMLPINNCITRLKYQAHLDTQPFRGDIVVMRVASKNTGSYVNMRDRDTILSDFVVIRYVCFLPVSMRLIRRQIYHVDRVYQAKG